MLKNPYHYEKPISWKLRKSDDENVFEIRVPKRRRDHQLFVVRAVGKNNHENSNSSSSGINLFISFLLFGKLILIYVVLIYLFAAVNSLIFKCWKMGKICVVFDVVCSVKLTVE